MKIIDQECNSNLNNNRMDNILSDTHIADLIKKRRLILGLSHEQLARAVGIKKEQLEKCEKNSNNIILNKLHQLVKLFKRPIV